MPKQPRPALSETWRLAGTRSKRAPVATLEGPPSNGFAVTALACRVGSSNERWFHNQVTRGKRHNARTLALRALRGAETRRHTLSSPVSSPTQKGKCNGFSVTGSTVGDSGIKECLSIIRV
jgi:hypothetical protein